MLVNELTFSELKSIIDPVIRLEPMIDVVSKIGEPLLIEKPSRKKILEHGNKQLLRYKGFKVFISDLRWIKNQGPCIIIQLSNQITKFESFFYKYLSINNWFRKLACQEVINDLQKICKSNIQNKNFATKELEAYNTNGKINAKFSFWVSYPSNAYNYNWDEGRDISPLLISNEYHSDKWFIMFSFNAGSFEILNNQTTLRDDWEQYLGQVSKSINLEALRKFKPDQNGNKSFEDWSEDMILDYGDEIIPKLEKIWERITK